jgi:hypothetical protein
MTDDAKALDVQIELTREDWVELALHVNNRHRKRWLLVALGFALILSLGLLSPWRGPINREQHIMYWLGFGCLAFLLLSITDRFQRWGLRLRSRKLGWRDGLHPNRIILTPEGIIDSGEAGEGLTYWSAVEKLVLTREHFFLMLGPNEGMIVPCRSFESTEAFTIFAQTAQQYHQQVRR